MKALNVAVIVLAVLLLVLIVWQAAGGKLPRWREHFDSTHSLTVSWSPPGNYPFPQNLVYNWAYCNSASCNNYVSTGQCPSPPGDPMSWTYHGTVSAPTLALTSANCAYCTPGCKGTLMLQAVDSVTKLTGPWISTTVDLTGGAPQSVAITDASGQPVAEGTTDFVYALTLDPAAWASGNKGDVWVQLLRGGSQVFTTGYLPFTSVSGATGTFNGSLTNTSIWAQGQAPGVMQVNDKLTVFGQVYSPAKDGPIYYWGSFAVTAAAVAPGGPSQVSWVLS